MKCSKCGEKKVGRMVEAIKGDKILTYCSSCASEGGLLIVKKDDPEQANREFDPSEYKRQLVEKYEDKNVERELAENVSLRDIIEKNYSKKISSNGERDDLVHNFHWMIMRARRSKKISQAQFAEMIKEPRSAVEMMEKGILPKDSDALIRKIESYLGINIRTNNEDSGEIEKFNPFRKDEFDRFEVENLTVDDLKSFESSEKKEPYWKKFMGKLIKKREKVDEDIEELADSGESMDLKFENEQKEISVKDLEKTGERISQEKIQEEIRKAETEKPRKNDLSDDEINSLIFRK